MEWKMLLTATIAFLLSFSTVSGTSFWHSWGEPLTTEKLAGLLSDNASQDAYMNHAAGPYSSTFVETTQPVSYTPLEDIPAAYDLRSADRDGDGIPENYITAVKRQSPFGTCWSFSALAALEGSIQTELGEPVGGVNPGVDLSERHLAWFGGTRDAEADGEQAGEGLVIPGSSISSQPVFQVGASPLRAGSILSIGVGPVLEEDAPYRGNYGWTLGYPGLGGMYDPSDDWSLPESLRTLSTYPLEESFSLPTPASYQWDEEGGFYYYVHDEMAEAILKEQILNGRPVQIAFHADPDFTEGYMNTDTWSHYTPSSEWEGDASVAPNHEVCIVGWDDSYPKENFTQGMQPPADGAWIVKNSWGSLTSSGTHWNEWGEFGSGYFHISYYDRTICYPESFDAVTEPTDAAPVAYDHMPFDEMETTLFRRPMATANVFSAEGSIESISYRTQTGNSTVSWELRGLDGDWQTPRDGRLLAAGEEFHEFAGFHRVALDQPVPVPVVDDSSLAGDGMQIALIVTIENENEFYEVSAGRYASELEYRVQQATGLGRFDSYGVGVVNPGESWVCAPDNRGQEAWWDWADIIDARYVASNEELEAAGIPDLITAAEGNPSLSQELQDALDAAWHDSVPMDAMFVFDNFPLRIYTS